MEEFEIEGMAERLLSYASNNEPTRHAATDGDELVEKAITLLNVLPRNQRRETVEGLLSPNDPEKGRHAVDVLIADSLVTEDAQGRLQRIDR